MRWAHPKVKLLDYLSKLLQGWPYFFDQKIGHIQFDLDLNNSVMASDAFFPFPDCVEIASKSGVSAVIQPGGSKNDNLSIDFCDKNNLTMVFTKTRHFKH